MDSMLDTVNNKLNAIDSKLRVLKKVNRAVAIYKNSAKNSYDSA